jgi:alkyl hydroperoxide reductase subunit AhpC
LVKLSTRHFAQLGLAAAFVVLTMSVATLVLVPRFSKPLGVADVGTVAPDFELTDVHGAMVSLSDFRGQAVVLFFSSLKSSASVQYEERVERLAHSYDTDNRVKFLAINVGDGQHIDPILLHLDERLAARSYPTLLDDKAFVASRYSATATPMMVVIDPHGVVRYRGPFDNNADLAFASHSFLTDALQDVLERTTMTVASK